MPSARTPWLTVIVVASLMFGLAGTVFGIVNLTRVQGPANTNQGVGATPGSASPPASQTPSEAAMSRAVAAYFANACSPAQQASNPGPCSALESALHDSVAAYFANACSAAQQASNPGPCSALSSALGPYYASHPQEAARAFGQGSH